MAELILLNGSPSAGKTTLAAAIQEIAPMPLFHRSLDDFIDGYGRRFATELFERTMIGFLGSLRALALTGNDVVAEAVIIPERKELYATTFAEVPTWLVGVHCPLEICAAREAGRNRPGGPLELDVPWFETVHQVPYDLEVDTSTDEATAEAAQRVVALIQSPPEARAFSRLH